MSGSPPIMTDIDEDDWIVVPTDCWRTPFTSVSWTYTQPKTGECVYAKAPHRPDSLSRKRTNNLTTPSRHSARFYGLEEELELSGELVGVRSVIDALSVYEKHVGIEVSSDKPTPDLSRKVEEDEVAVHQLRWRELMKDFVGNLPEQGDQSSDSESSGSPLFSSLESSRSSISSFEFVEFDQDHFLSMPSTPKPNVLRPSTEDDWMCPRVTRSCNLSPFGASPSKRLNASAVTFIPQLPRPGSLPVPSLSFSSDSSPQTSASSPSPPLLDFTFPSLNVPSIPKMKIEKDDQGFYTGIEEDASSNQSKARTTSLLPAFLQEESPRRKSPSRTRAIVDKLRSASQGAIDPFDRFHLEGCTMSESGEADLDAHTPTPPIGDAEGWISVDVPANPLETSVAAKAQRKRDLFLALNKHQRSESGPASTTSQERTDVDKLSNSLASNSVMTTNDDGWIESVPPAQSKQQRKRQSSQSSKKRASSSGKIIVPKSSLGGSAPKFPTLNPTEPGSQKPKSYHAPNMSVPKAPVPPVPAPAPLAVPYAYGGYPVMAPVPMSYAPPYLVMQYPQVQQQPPNHHQRAQSLAVPPMAGVGYAPSGKAPFVPSHPPHPHMIPVNYPAPSSGMRPTMW